MKLLPFFLYLLLLIITKKEKAFRLLFATLYSLLCRSIRLVKAYTLSDTQSQQTFFVCVVCCCVLFCFINQALTFTS